MYKKTLSLDDCEIKLKDDSGHFAGYASTFHRIDLQGDMITKGAYSQTLREFGMPKMLVQHDSRSLPIGKWISAKEDDHGLLVEGEFTPGMARAEETRAALRHGTVGGLSMGYVLQKGDYEERPEGRLIRRVSRLVEISVVTFPADSAARVNLASIKSEELEQIERIETIRDLERFLREVSGFDQVTAKRLTIKARELFAQDGDDAQEQAAEKKFAAIATNITNLFSRSHFAKGKPH